MAFFQFAGTLGLIRLLVVRHHHRDLTAEVLFVEAERLLALPSEVDIDIEFHRILVVIGPSFHGPEGAFCEMTGAA